MLYPVLVGEQSMNTLHLFTAVQFAKYLYVECFI